MSSEGLRAGAGALSIVLTAGAGLVTNLVTDRPSLAWGVCLGALVLCAVTLAIVSPLLDRREATGTRGVNTVRDSDLNDFPQEDPPSVRQLAWGGGTAVNAGNNVSMGISGRHLIIIIAILAGATLTAVVFSVRERGAEAGSTGQTISTSRDATSPTEKPARPMTVTSTPQRRPNGAHSRTLNQFSFLMQRGFAYDIDVESGTSPANFGWLANQEGDAERDLYLTGPDLLWKIYAPMPPKRDIKPGGLVVVDRTSEPADCPRAMPANGRDFVDSTTASTGDKACLQTGKGRWAMIELIKLPGSVTDPAEVELTLLT